MERKKRRGWRRDQHRFVKERKKERKQNKAQKMEKPRRRKETNHVYGLSRGAANSVSLQYLSLFFF